MLHIFVVAEVRNLQVMAILLFGKFLFFFFFVILSHQSIRSGEGVSSLTPRGLIRSKPFLSTDLKRQMQVRWQQGGLAYIQSVGVVNILTRNSRKR